MSVFRMQNSEGEEYSLFKDFLNFSFDKEIGESLIKMGEDHLDGKCLSDYFYMITKSGKRVKMAILVGGGGIFFFKKSKIVRFIKFESLKEIVISAKNCTLAALVVTTGLNVMIDTYRRLEIVLYIA